MPVILHDFHIRAAAAKVFDAVAAPIGLDSWWTKGSSGFPCEGNEYKLWFGPEYDWLAVVSICDPSREFELTITRARADWTGTRVGFILEERNGTTRVQFRHAGWPDENAHFRTSSFRWATYLRLLKRYVETGEVVGYEERPDA